MILTQIQLELNNRLLFPSKEHTRRHTSMHFIWTHTQKKELECSKCLNGENSNILFFKAQVYKEISASPVCSCRGEFFL